MSSLVLARAEDFLGRIKRVGERVSRAAEIILVGELIVQRWGDSAAVRMIDTDLELNCGINGVRGFRRKNGVVQPELRLAAGILAGKSQRQPAALQVLPSAYYGTPRGAFRRRCCELPV